VTKKINSVNLVATMELFHELWFLEQHGALDQVLEVGVHTGTDARVLRRPLASRHVDVIANLTSQTHPHLIIGTLVNQGTI